MTDRAQSETDRASSVPNESQHCDPRHLVQILSVCHAPLARVVVLVLLIAIIAAALGLHLSGIKGYTMACDDFPLIRDALSWERTEQALWEPYNNHLFPLFRLLTWGLVACSTRLSEIPNWLLFGWTIGFLVAMLVLYEFVSRETGSPTLGIVATAIAGMSSAFDVGVGQYPTTQIYWAISFTLIALLNIQSIHRQFSWRAVGCASVLAMLAPAWRMEGVLAGPITCLYAASIMHVSLSPRQRAAMLVGPLLGTCLYVCFAMIVSGAELFHAPWFHEGTPLVDFHPLLGAYLTARMSTEHLLLWNLGLRSSLPVEQFLVLFGVLVALCVFWFRRSRLRGLSGCGLSLMLASYMFVFTIRGNLGMEGLRASAWYLIIPNFGWAIFVTAGLDPLRRYCGQEFTLKDVARVAVLGLGLFLLHRPVAVKLNMSTRHMRQRNELKQLELIERLSHRWAIDRGTLTKSIGPFSMSGSHKFDGLSLIEPPRVGGEWNHEELRSQIAAALNADLEDAFRAELAEKPSTRKRRATEVYSTSDHETKDAKELESQSPVQDQPPIPKRNDLQ